jgi:hypothetical protein
MPTTTFLNAENNATSVLAQPHVSGGGTLVLRTGDGARFGSTFPARVTAVNGTTGAVAIYRIAARSGDTLTVGAAIEGTADADLPAGSKVEMRPTKGSFADIHAAVNALEQAAVDSGDFGGTVLGADAIAMGSTAIAGGVASIATGDEAITAAGSGIAAGGGSVTTAAGGLSLGDDCTAGRFPVACTISGTTVTIDPAYGDLIGTLLPTDGASLTLFRLSGGSGATAVDALASSARYSAPSTVLTLQSAVTTHTSGYAAVSAFGAGSLAAGRFAAAQGEYSAAFGEQSTTTADWGFSAGFAGYADLPCKFAIGGGTFAGGMSSWAAEADVRSPYAAAYGDCQASTLVLGNATTDGSPTTLVIVQSSGASAGNDSPLAASAANLPLVRRGIAYAFDLTIVGRKSDGSKVARFARAGIIQNTAGTTALVGSVQTTGADINAPGWSVSVAADDSNNALAVSVTGEAGVHWAARLDCVEVG